MNGPLRTRLWISVLVVGSSLASADEPDPGVPAPTNVRGAEYPRVHADSRVTFRIKAPDARSVEFDRGKRYPATRSEDGFWTATTDPQEPGFHYYGVVIDGVMVN